LVAVRVRLLSDLHLEFGAWDPPAVDADVVVLAGDIWKRDQGLRWASRHFPPERTIVLAGNHEHYGQLYQDVMADCRTTAAELGCHFLENDTVVLEGVRFIGATLWTDFALNGDGGLQMRSMDLAQEMMNDFHLIQWREGEQLRLFQPRDAARLHHASRRFLEAQLAERFSGPTVVVTHYLPHRTSIAERFIGSDLNPAFCSDLSALIEEAQPALWLHGHSHDSCDHRVGKTRVVCNPRGYHPHELNPDFDSNLVIEI
jgi:Icc-related predicted phosphoesterase